MKNTTNVNPRIAKTRLFEGGRMNVSVRIANKAIAAYIQADTVKRTASGFPLTLVLLPILFNFKPFEFQIT